MRYAEFMRAKELIPVLSDKLGVPLETAWVMDRSLADAGLRAKVKGRTPPSMTRVEALHFLIACITAKVATRAAEDVEYWLAFRGRVYEDFADEEGDWGLMKCLLRAVEAFEGESMPNPLQRRIVFSLSHRDIVFEILGPTGRWAVSVALEHPEEGMEEIPPYDSAIHRESHVNGIILREIAKHTAQPEEVEHAEA